MKTFYRDFAEGHIEAAWRYAAQQSTLGHNVRLVTSTNPKYPAYRVLFSAVQCQPTAAVNVYAVPER